jgi:hypothetical protein
VHIELSIDAIHAPGVEKNQRNEYVDRTLLCEPEAQLKAAESNAIELLDEQHAESIGTDEPDDETDSDQSQIGAPVRQPIFGMPVFRQHFAPGFTQLLQKVPGTKKRLLAKPLFNQR